jgi:thiamine kinase-like enzyme
VRAFLSQHFANRTWSFTFPQGHGNETYFARCGDQALFIKLGAQAARYQALAANGLSPPVLAEGCLEDGISILIQPYITGRNPTRRDYQTNLELFAQAIHSVHHCLALKRALPQVSDEGYSQAGLAALAAIQKRWEQHKHRVPQVAGFIDESFDHLRQQVQDFEGAGLVAAHNDLCNGNWLVAPDGKIYLLDLEAMSMEDPALDIGATLWWYYPPEIRHRFLEIVGDAHDDAFQHRMQIRMAMHCLHIILPRPGSFDRFRSASFSGALVDFRAALAGEENPQGYADLSF